MCIFLDRMMLLSMKSLFLILSAVVMTTMSADVSDKVSLDASDVRISTHNGRVEWFPNCKWLVTIMGTVRSRSQDCGLICLRDSQCTHFTHSNGMCTKHKGRGLNYGMNVWKGSLCGWIPSRVGV